MIREVSRFGRGGGPSLRSAHIFERFLKCLVRFLLVQDAVTCESLRLLCVKMNQ
jgi:hypothetical protein